MTNLYPLVHVPLLATKICSLIFFVFFMFRSPSPALFLFSLQLCWLLKWNKLSNFNTQHTHTCFHFNPSPLLRNSICPFFFILSTIVSLCIFILDRNKNMYVYIENIGDLKNWERRCYGIPSRSLEFYGFCSLFDCICKDLNYARIWTKLLYRRSQFWFK